MVGQTRFKPVKLRLKIDLVSYPARAEGLVNMVIYYLHTRLNCFKYYKWLKSSILPTGRTLISTSTLGQCAPGSNGNEGVLHILQSSRTNHQLQFRIKYRILIGDWILPLCRDIVIVFYTPTDWSKIISLFTNPTARAGYDTRSIFKLSLTGLNSEFSFS